MTQRVFLSACVASLYVAAGAGLAAQAPKQPTGEAVHLTGCIMRGEAKEFVLATGTSTPTSSNRAATVAQSTSAATRFRLSGNSDLSNYVGQRVDIVGRLDPGATLARGSASGGAVGTSGRLPDETDISAGAAALDGVRATDTVDDTTPADKSAVGTSGRSIPMEHVTVTSVRAVSATCR